MKKRQLPLKVVSGSSKEPPGKEFLEELLKCRFGLSSFRDKQFEAIQAALSGRDCFCLMPTGGGKSMCYQIPALAKIGIVLVVSPLIGAIENQVNALRQKGIPAEYLSSMQDAQVRETIQEELDCGRPSIRLLYVTPELIATPGFKEKLNKLHIRGLLSLIAIDEAHCISSWGHDFRPAYKKLSYLKMAHPDVPLLALTATAGPKVEKDVIESLGLQNPLILRASFNRPNIFYEVRYKDIIDDIHTDLCNLFKARGALSSIIYCLERTTCDFLSANLRKNGISCSAYHAGLSSKTRSDVLDNWISSRIQVVAATVAFGMGIDKKDVRFVFHYNIPKSMESFYQESGRAGRDNLPSKSVLYYGLDDRRRMEFILRNAGSRRHKSSTVAHTSVEKSLNDFSKMVEYCEVSGCRRKKILECFGEKASLLMCNKTCDVCKNPSVVDGMLSKLDHVSSSQQFYGPAPVFVKSSEVHASVDRETEFWNREGEENSSEESISASEDEGDTMETSIKYTSRGKINVRRIEQLQKAEERFYASNGCAKRKTATSAIPDSLREAAKKRLCNALNQAHMRAGTPLLYSPRCDLDVSASLLEVDCYEKFKRAGRNFYNCQVAGMVRWLSSSSYAEIKARLSTLATQLPITTTPDGLVPENSSQKGNMGS
ncbi:DEAD/DEAH box RNA helicase family protein [Wolffia australiana]